MTDEAMELPAPDSGEKPSEPEVLREWRKSGAIKIEMGEILAYVDALRAYALSLREAPDSGAGTPRIDEAARRGTSYTVLELARTLERELAALKEATNTVMVMRLRNQYDEQVARADAAESALREERERWERLLMAARTIQKNSNYTVGIPDGDPSKGPGNDLADALAAIDAALKGDSK